MTRLVLVLVPAGDRLGDHLLVAAILLACLALIFAFDSIRRP